MKLELNNFTQAAVLLPVHVRRRAAGRSVLRQQPRWGRPQVQHPRRRELRARPRRWSCVGAKLFDLPIGRRGRHAGRLADHVGGDRLGRAGGAAGRGQAAGRAARPRQVNAMIALSYGITYIWGTVGIILIMQYLPQWWGVDARAAARPTRRSTAWPAATTPAFSGWTARRPARLPARERAVGRPDAAAIPPRASRVPGGQPGRGTASALGADLRRAAAARRRDRARRPARGDDREDGPDRPGGRRPSRARRAARPGRDPRHQQGDPEEDARGMARPAGRRPDPGRAALERAGVPIPIGRDTELQRMDVIIVVGHQGRGRQGRRRLRPDRTPSHRHRPADAVARA